MATKKLKLQTITQAAASYKGKSCDRQWIHKLIVDGRVPGAQKIGNTWLVPRPFKFISKNA